MKRAKTVFILFVFAVLMAGCNKKASIKASEYVELGEYKGLSVERMDTTVTDEDVEGELEAIKMSLAKTEKITDRDVVKQGDIVNIDFTGTKDGIAFDGGSAEAVDLEIGGGKFIPGFEDGLVGQKVGDVAVLDLTFPEYYPNNPELQGAAVKFTVKINYICKKVYPELTNKFIEKQTGGEFQTLEKYKAGIREDIQKEKNEYADTKMYADLLAQVVESSTVIKDIPEEYLQKKIDVMRANVRKYADSYQVDYATFLQNNMGLTIQQFEDECKKYAVTAAKESLVIEAIAEKENISLSRDDMKDAIEEYTVLFGYATEDQFKEKTDMEQFEYYILQSKVQEFLADNAVITISDEKAW